MTFTDLIAKLSPDPNLRGREFERLAQWYLVNAPEYRTHLKQVWLWDDWPGRWGRDIGIDLVAETASGELWAVQAKAPSDPAHSITKREIDSFLSESNRPEFSFRLLIATTDGLSSNAYSAIVGQEKPVGLLLRSRLEASEIEWPQDLSRLVPRRPRAHQRRQHQVEAVDEVVKEFSRHDRGQLIMACGTGKTLVSLWIAEDLECERVLVLVPSLTLLSQTLAAWTANSIEPMDYIAVCSDETVVERDAIVSHISDLGIPVTTDPAIIAAFMAENRRRIVFATYQSSERISEAQGRGGPEFDLLVADEAHRCAGPSSGVFATVLDETRIRARRRLFMTATPRYFTGRLRKVAGEAGLEVASMDDEARFGPVFHKLSFGEAIERDLLMDYIVLVIGVDEGTYKRYLESGELVATDQTGALDARSLAYHIGLAKAIRSYNLQRVISFHGRVRRAQAFSALFPEVVAWMPVGDRPEGSVWSNYVSGEMTSGRRDILLREFKRLQIGRRGLLSNARCLSEGVDVPSIDGVAFIDPRSSAVDIIQCVGRAIRLSPDKKVGVVVLPVFIETEVDAASVLDQSVFKPVWDVLKALRAHDGVLAEELDGLRRRIGRERTESISRPAKIVLDVPVGVGHEFIEAFNVRLVEEVTERWEWWFGLLERFVAREGHARVPNRHMEAGYALGAWTGNQRARYRGGGLDAQRVAELESLPGWYWDKFDEGWRRGFDRLKSFVAREGHAKVPAGHKEEGISLQDWAALQRIAYQKGKLEPERIAQLESLSGWSWDPFDDAWREGFTVLERFVAREGHAKVPGRHKEDGFLLGQWVSVKRRTYQKGNLESERIAQLESLSGWSWDPFDDAWREGFGILEHFIAREGHAKVPHGRKVEGFSLSGWVATQRRDYRKGKLDSERIAQLETLPGWSWDPLDDAWREGYGILGRFVAREGHAKVPHGRKVEGISLQNWVVKQRRDYHKGKLESERIAQLESLSGWSWDPQHDAWREGFGMLERFIAREGHAKVPQRHKEEGFPLGQWVAVKRRSYDKGKLESERIAQLESLPGWTFRAPRSRRKSSGA